MCIRDRNGSVTRYQFFDAETGEQIAFQSLVYGWINYDYRSNFNPDDKWLPVVQRDGEWVPYQGGRVVFQVYGGSGIEDYAFTLKYLDDYAGSVDTLGEMDPLEGEIRGYVGDINDQDWIEQN